MPHGRWNSSSLRSSYAVNRKASSRASISFISWSLWSCSSWFWCCLGNAKFAVSRAEEDPGDSTNSKDVSWIVEDPPVTGKSTPGGFVTSCSIVQPPFLLSLSIDLFIGAVRREAISFIECRLFRPGVPTSIKVKRALHCATFLVAYGWAHTIALALCVLIEIHLSANRVGPRSPWFRGTGCSKFNQNRLEETFGKKHFDLKPASRRIPSLSVWILQVFSRRGILFVNAKFPSWFLWDISHVGQILLCMIFLLSEFVQGRMKCDLQRLYLMLQKNILLLDCRTAAWFGVFDNLDIISPFSSQGPKFRSRRVTWFIVNLAHSSFFSWRRDGEQCRRWRHASKWVISSRRRIRGDSALTVGGNRSWEVSVLYVVDHWVLCWQWQSLDTDRPAWLPVGGCFCAATRYT